MSNARNIAALSTVEVGATADQTKADLNAIGVSGGRKNLIINGGMQVAQRGTSFTADNVYTLDRWRSADGVGSPAPARTISQQTFTLGQTDVPNAHHYLRHVQTIGTPNAGTPRLIHKVEDVTQTAGQTVTYSFYAKAASATTVDVRFVQSFGSGGSPSSSVTTTEAGVVIGTSWARHVITKSIPSIAGKTLGTNGLNTTHLTMDMGVQSTSTFTFEITNIQLELGSVATDFEHRSYGEELALCQRYYYKHLAENAYNGFGLAMAYTATNCWIPYIYPTVMRGVPSFTYGGALQLYSGAFSDNISNVTLVQASSRSGRLNITVATPTGSGACVFVRAANDTSAYLAFDAEL